MFSGERILKYWSKVKQFIIEILQLVIQTLFSDAFERAQFLQTKAQIQNIQQK